MVALARSRAAVRGLEQAGAQVVRANLNNPAGLAEVLNGCDGVAHLAYDMRASGQENLRAFETLLTASRQAGISHFVHASSVVVYDDWPHGAISEQSSTTSPHGGPYRRAKIAMEQMLAKQDMAATILQPTVVYGPGSALWTTRYARALMGGGVVLPAEQGLCHAVFVDDVAAAIAHAFRRGGDGCARYIITGPEPVLWSDLIAGYSARLGRGEVVTMPVEKLRTRLGPLPVAEASDQGPGLAAKVSARARRLIGNERFEALVARACASGRRPTPVSRPLHAGSDDCARQHIKRRGAGRIGL